MYKNHNYIPTIFEVNAFCKCNDFSHSLGTSIFFLFFYKMTPVLLQGTVWGYEGLCDSSSWLFQTERAYRLQFWIWWKWQKVVKWVENTVGKGEIARGETCTTDT